MGPDNLQNISQLQLNNSLSALAYNNFPNCRHKDKRNNILSASPRKTVLVDFIDDAGDCH